MTVYSIIMAATFIIAGAGVSYTGIKAGQGQLPMNSWVGLRTQKLMASEEAWVRGHKAGSSYLKFSGILLVIGGILFLVLDESIISFVSIPVVMVLVFSTMLAAQKANAAVSR